MKGKKKQSITIDFYSEEKEISKFKNFYMILVQAILLIFSTLGSLQILLTAMKVPVSFGKLSGFSIFIIIMFFFIFMFRKWTKYILPLSGICYLFLLIKNFEEVKEGCFSIFNIYIKQYNKYSDMNLIGFPTRYPDEESVILMFLFFVLVPMIGTLSYVVIRNRKHLLYFIITIPFIIIALSIGKVPDSLSFGLYFIAAMGVISASGVKKQKGNETDINMYQSAVVVFAIFIGIMAVSMKFLTKDTYDNKMNVGEIKAGWQKSMAESNISEMAAKLILKNSAAGGIGEGRLGRVGSVKFKNSVMFEITMPELMNNLYLRSYVGSTYNSSGWSPLETEELEEYRIVLEDLREQGFSSTEEGIKFLEVFNEMNLSPLPFIKTDITIKDIQDEEKYQKVPYYATCLPDMDAVEQEITPFLNKQSPSLINRYLGYFFTETDSSASSPEEMYRVVLYNYTVAEIQKNAIELLLEKSIEEFDEQDKKFYEGVKVSEIYEKYNNKYSLRNNMTVFNPDIMVNDIVEVLKKYSAFANQEEQYRNIVYRKYLQLPSDSCESLMKEWANNYYYESVIDKVKDGNHVIYFKINEKEKSHLILTEYTLENGSIRYDTNTGVELFDIGEVVAYVKDYLNQNTKYSLEPGNTPYGKDFIEYFLTENKKGYCTYYATTATIMFRSMGIPARYVEGYVVTHDDIKYARQNGNGIIEQKYDGRIVKNETPIVTAGIRDSNAHAWTEIYLDGYGWVPVDVTPGYTIDGVTALPKEITNPQATQENAADLESQNKPENTGEFDNQIPEDYNKPEDTAGNAETENNQENTQTNDEKVLPKRVKTENEIFMGNVYKTMTLLEIIVGASIVFMTIIYFRWIIFFVKKKNMLRDGDNLVKINMYYKDIRCMLTYYGVREENLSNYTKYCQEVEDKLYLPEKRVFTECINTMIKSKFSENGITGEELIKVKKCYDFLRESLGFRTNRFQRLKLKYLNIIYPIVRNDDSATRNIK